MITTKKTIVTIIAGGNASGKNTLVSALYQSGFFTNEQFIGPDLILSNELAPLNLFDANRSIFDDNQYDEKLYSHENYLKAFKIADARRESLIDKRKDFVMETVLSTDPKMELIAVLKERGYYVRIIYIGVDADETNAVYLIRRLRDGGHDVPLHKLLKRKKLSLRKLYAIVRSKDIDQVILVDNSIFNEIPHVIAVYNFGYKPFESGSKRDSGMRVYTNGFFPERDYTIELNNLMVSEIQTLIKSLEKTIKYFFLQTTMLRSYSLANSFIREQVDEI